MLRRSCTLTWELQVHFTRETFAAGNTVLARVLDGAGERRHRVLAVIDAGVLACTPRLPGHIARYAQRHRGRMQLVAPPFVVPGGEACKSDPRAVEAVCAQIERHGLCRQSFLLAIGGGAVLDAAGLAAALAHRGVRLIRMPTTVLAQNDAGVGVKNGINAFGRKNFLGTFAPPFAVVNDLEFLRTLDARDRRAGLAEAVKVALVRDREFFDLLWRERRRLAAGATGPLEETVVRCAELHLDHIVSRGDPFERGSSRPLDFGHWSAHALEELSAGALRHGEAVAIGIALDALYSVRSGLLGEPDGHRVLALLEDLGFALFDWALESLDVQAALARFQEHLGGERAIPLLRRPGEVLDVRAIDARRMRGCVAELARRHGAAAARAPAAARPGDGAAQRDALRAR
ncbi:MAG TPA: 3-dehydroquinate synthase [bacterium]